MKKKLLAVVMSMVFVTGMLAGCGSSTKETSTKDTKSTETESKDSYTIGISQFAEHGSLDNCREGFLEGLKEAGIEEGKNLKVNYDNAQADTGTAGTIADSYVSKKVDLICAIATPSAMSAYNAAMSADIPVVYTAVSDPVGAGLAKEDGSNAGNITGSCDLLPVDEQLKMIRKMLPYKKVSDKFGFEIVDTGINTLADVDMAAADLVGKVDCICNLTDNTVVQALQTVIEKANSKKIPVFGSEIEQVKAGCVAAMGIDYFELGKNTGAMAAKILKGEATAKDTEYIKTADSALYVNTEAADKIGMELDKDYIADAAETFTEITVE